MLYMEKQWKIWETINVKLVNKEREMYIKTNLYVSQKFDNNLVVIHKSKVALKLNKPVYTGMCIMELSKVLTYEFHYDYIKNTCYNK